MYFKCEYYNKFERSHLIKDLKICFYKQTSYYFKLKKFNICGRVFRKRVMGKASFLFLKDVSDGIQVYVSSNYIIDYHKFISDLNIGDIIGVRGFLFVTKTNELSLKAVKIYILSTNLKTFPDKMVGLVNKEICYRYRYLDLMVNIKSKAKFLLRHKIISLIRLFFLNDNFIEVETPIMQKIAGGADAEPFKTYHNYLDSHLYFRISPELYLKKLLVGGFEKVFEIGKNFRNEGVSIKHHPEFTMIEFYCAYSNYSKLILLTEKFFSYIMSNLFNTLILKYNNHILDFSKKFIKINFIDAIVFYCKDLTLRDVYDKHKMIKFLLSNNISVDEKYDLYDLQCKIFDRFVESNLIQPTFIMHHPIAISPLSKESDILIDCAERFELYICGKEIANGFSELNDPLEQKKRFIKQLNGKDLDKYYDSDYINALEYGLPPSAGEGIGIDRLIMLFTNSQSIKDVILFPLMKFKD